MNILISTVKQSESKFENELQPLAPASQCIYILPCHFQNKLEISSLFTRIQLLLAMAINCIPLLICFRCILEIKFESCRSHICQLVCVLLPQANGGVIKTVNYHSNSTNGFTTYTISHSSHIQNMCQRPLKGMSYKYMVICEYNYNFPCYFWIVQCGLMAVMTLYLYKSLSITSESPFTDGNQHLALDFWTSRCMRIMPSTRQGQICQKGHQVV